MTAAILHERIARALHKAHKPWCDHTYDFEHPMASREVYEALADAVIAELWPMLAVWMVDRA